MTSFELYNAIYSNLATLRTGSLSFWGDWFGKPHDNIHRIVGVDASDNTVTVFFDHAETLIVDEPQDWSLDGGCLLVRKAKLVRFQWFYYGSLPSRETLLFCEYRMSEGRLNFHTDFQPSWQPKMDENAPAVQLHSL